MATTDGVTFGDVLLMRGFKRTKVGPLVEVTLTYKVPKEKDVYDVFLYLGAVKRDELKDLSVDARLEALGWTPPVPAAVIENHCELCGEFESECICEDDPPAAAPEGQ